jgi:hypothetical protein
MLENALSICLAGANEERPSHTALVTQGQFHPVKRSRGVSFAKHFESLARQPVWALRVQARGWIFVPVISDFVKHPASPSIKPADALKGRFFPNRWRIAAIRIGRKPEPYHPGSAACCISKNRSGGG